MQVNNLRLIDSRTSEEGVLRAMEAGARAYIRKPLR